MKIKYVTSRLAVALISTHADIEKIIATAEARHKQYHHFFNLTMLGVEEAKQTGFKWRGLPFSLTETIKLLLQIDIFLRINLANAAIVCVSNDQMEQYVLFALKTYLQWCVRSAKEQTGASSLLKIQQLAVDLTKSRPYLSREMHQIYKNIKVDNPPVMILESLAIEPEDQFIPVVEIFSEGRYNDFQMVYQHNIQEELATYYLDLGKPLETGIGTRYYDCRPETKYFKGPVTVAGDVKIVVYSYKHLAKVREFTIGFNTHNMDSLNIGHKGELILQDADLYQKNKELTSKFSVKIEFSHFCQNSKCRSFGVCPECKEVTKRLTSRYSDCQIDLQRLSRVRTGKEILSLLSPL